MKKMVVVFAFMFLLLVGIVSAMDDPIRVKAGAENEVRLFIWPAEYGPAINSDKGFADADGDFASKTFFSLNEDNFTLQIYVFNTDGDKKSYGRFEEMNSFSPIFIDCLSSECKLSSPWDIENKTSIEIEDIVENETVEIVEFNESVVENQTVVVEEESFVKEGVRNIYFSGKAIFHKEDGSINLGFSIGGVALLVFLILLVFMTIFHGKKKVVLDDDDKELSEAEQKLKATEDKIKSIKDAEAKKKKLAEIKAKLAADEKELEGLEKPKETVVKDAVQKKPEDDKKGAVAGEWD